MTFYHILNRALPNSYRAKFQAVLAGALVAPLLSAVLVPTGSPAGLLAVFCVTLISGIGAQRAISALLAPLARISESLQRTEAGIRPRPLPCGNRDELGFMMECTNRLAGHLEGRMTTADNGTEQGLRTGRQSCRSLVQRIPGAEPSKHPFGKAPHP